MSKKNDYLEKLKAAKAEAARLAEEASKPKGLPCGSCGQPSRGLINGVCFACDEKARREAKRSKMPQSSGAVAPEPAKAIAERVNAPTSALRPVRRLYLVASNGNILI